MEDRYRLDDDIRNELRKARSYHIDPFSGVGFIAFEGQEISVIDVEGGQVSDLACWTLFDNSLLDEPMADVTQYLSSGRSIDIGGKIYFTTGDVLYSNQSEPMLTILHDDANGAHDFITTPCSQQTFRDLYPGEPWIDRPNCLDNIWKPLVEYGVQSHIVPITFNIFMNVQVTNGKTKFLPPVTQARDRITFRAEQDLVVAVTSCSSGICNFFTYTPIEVEVSKWNRAYRRER